jgi:heme/copper-type cytochrome/quinol oxidase subunit 3
MGAGFWISRYLLASSILFIILAVVEYSKGSANQASLLSALAWSLVASAIFVGSKYWRYRKAVACETCSGDKPKTKSP